MTDKQKKISEETRESLYNQVSEITARLAAWEKELECEMDWLEAGRQIDLLHEALRELEWTKYDADREMRRADK